ncbi:HlyD family type I secretion periplasmic adaptor subunit [Nitrincola tibetensis]|uniref:Membrane fusion protein (MFP) family protein n=1 Tax=Nitrincola tibetensis TaxID=2219697 RepID=A0A364NNF8_9GAMM|nr:HlyD family type I secretion periplasmic adaptor subunit [Nitrincola tibetensis]RAU18415.1 HlyD family type I secretion periplasmic adaptor subunit [Nitrincola tibetensis]
MKLPVPPSNLPIISAEDAETAHALSDRHPKRLGYILLLLTFGVFGTWASLAPLEGAAHAPGIVTVENYRKTVQHYEGGRVNSLHVREGDWVDEGALLLTLDDTQFRAELDIIGGQLLASRASEARLRAERDKLDSITFPDDFDKTDARVEETLTNEQQLFTARQNSHQGEIDVLKQRINQYEEQIRGLEAISRSKQSLISSYQSELQDLNRLLANGFVDRHRLKIVERNISELQGEVAENRAMIAGIRVQQGETQLQILLVEKEYHTQIVNQISEVQTRIFDLRKRFEAILDRVERTHVFSPESGRVIGMKVNTIGSVVQPGIQIMDIVPDTVDLIIEAQISPVDIDRVFTGKLADIRFSSFKAATTPVIQAQVVHISADRLINEQTGAPYFLSRLELTETGYQMLKDHQLVLVPGMPAEVLINTGQRTLLQYLTQPITNTLARSFIED